MSCVSPNSIQQDINRCLGALQDASLNISELHALSIPGPTFISKGTLFCMSACHVLRCPVIMARSGQPCRLLLSLESYHEGAFPVSLSKHLAQRLVQVFCFPSFPFHTLPQPIPSASCVMLQVFWALPCIQNKAGGCMLTADPFHFHSFLELHREDVTVPLLKVFKAQLSKLL